MNHEAIISAIVLIICLINLFWSRKLSRKQKALGEKWIELIRREKDLQQLKRPLTFAEARRIREIRESKEST